MPELHHDVPCPGCGCLCDDLTVETTAGQVTGTQPACRLSSAYLQAPLATAADCRVYGQPASSEQAIEAAAAVLQNARAPLYFGLGETTSEVVRKVVDLADQTGGILDATHPTYFDPTGRVLQTTGLVTCSLGEIRHRADLVVFWGCDPKTTHPRHWERYSVEPTGRFIPDGRADRHVVGMGQPNATTAACDTFLALAPAQQIAALHTLIAWAQGKPLNETTLQAQLGNAVEPLAQLHQQVQTAKYFVFVLGEGFLRRDLGRVPLELLSQYVRPLQEKTRWAISILRPGPNWVGAGGVVASRTGYPGGASLGQGFPLFDPDNSSAVELLTTKRVDAALLFTGPWQKQLPAAASERLSEIPTIMLGHHTNGQTGEKQIFIPIARPGVSDQGTMARMDDMPLPLRSLVSAEAFTAKEIIQALLEKTSN